MNENETPTGLRRQILRAVAYVRVAIWMAREVNPWRRSRYRKGRR